MNQLHEIFEQSTDAVFGLDSRGNIRFWNSACERLLGYTSEQACGRPCFGLFCGDRHPDYRYCKDRCLSREYFATTAPTRDLDHMVQRASGESILVNVGAYYTPTRTPADAKVYFSLRNIDCQRLLQRIGRGACDSRSQDSPNGNYRLTGREKSVLGLAAKGFRTIQIADQLNISSQTVCNHFKNIYPKLSVHSRAEAVGIALRHNLV